LCSPQPLPGHHPPWGTHLPLWLMADLALSWSLWSERGVSSCKQRVRSPWMASAQLRGGGRLCRWWNFINRPRKHLLAGFAFTRGAEDFCNYSPLLSGAQEMRQESGLVSGEQTSAQLRSDVGRERCDTVTSQFPCPRGCHRLHGHRAHNA